MIGIYLSGTGNTRHCTEKIIGLLDETAQTIPIEDKKAVGLLAQHDFIVLAYPTQFSNIPVMVRDFIKNNSELWQNKKVICIATMGLFSGDGAGCAARLLKKYGATVVGGLHIKMPDSVCDEKALKHTLEENQEIIKAADRKIEMCAEEIKQGIYPQDGLHFYNMLAGLFGQRLWFCGKTKDYTDKVKISDACIGCGLCARQCPMENLTLNNNKAIAGNRCTMCYRCISTCPKQAITLLGKNVVEQCRYDKYIKE